MSITIICGKTRAGKTALNTHLAGRSLQTRGNLWLKKSIAETNALMAAYNTKLPLPDIPPLLTNYESKFRIGYKKYIEPYSCNPYYIGFENEGMPIQYIPPYSELHITEGQTYWNSRESATLSDDVSRWFEQHGHFHLDIYIDVQRAKLIDKNIRDIANKIIEVQKMIHVKDVYGRILRTIWYCREFTSGADYEAYAEGGYASYSTTRYVHEGNIFECYNSHSCKGKFIPIRNNNFGLMKQLNDDEIRKLPDSQKVFYSSQMPKKYRAPRNKGVNTDNGQSARTAA